MYLAQMQAMEYFVHVVALVVPDAWAVWIDTIVAYVHASPPLRWAVGLPSLNLNGIFLLVCDEYVQLDAFLILTRPPLLHLQPPTAHAI